MILANGCNITKSEKFKGVWILSVPTVCIYIYILWRVSCLPPNYQHSPSLNRRPSPGSRREWVWERRGAVTARSGGVWWGTHLKWMEPHHRRCYMPVAPLLWRPVSSPCMHAGVLVGPGRERWGIGCRRRRELPDPRSGRGPHPRDGRRARMPGRLDPSSAAVDLEVDEAAGKAAVPRAPDLGGERVRPPDSAPYLDPSFQNTAPPSQPAQHNEDTRFPLLFWTLYSPWTLLLYYFCLIKASPRPDATPTVSVVCSSRHTGGECGQAEPRQRSWATPMTSSPLARRNSWKPALGRRNDGDGLPAT